MNVLVTGGAGFIGSYLCRALHDLGHSVRVADCAKRNGGLLTFDYRNLNILEKQGLKEAMRGVELVIHLAAKHKYFGVSEKEFFTVNEIGTRNILEVMSEADIRKIIFFSTVAVYGETNGPTDENKEPKPNTPYGLSKLAAENWVKKWALEGMDRSAIILRPTVIFGPKNKGNIYRLIRQIYHRIYIPIGKGNNIKSIAYIENVVKATIFLLNLEMEGIHIFNYSDEPHMEYREIVDIIYSGLTRKPPAYCLPVSPILRVANLLDWIISKAGIRFSLGTTILKMNKPTFYKSDKIRKFGFSPVCSSKEGLEKMVKWFIENKKQES